MQRINHVSSGGISTDPAVPWDGMVMGRYSVVLQADFLSHWNLSRRRVLLGLEVFLGMFAALV